MATNSNLPIGSAGPALFFNRSEEGEDDFYKVFLSMKWINLERFDHFCKYHYRKWDKTLSKGTLSLLKNMLNGIGSTFSQNNQKFLPLSSKNRNP